MVENTDIRYPVVVCSPAGEPIARINPDATWSIKWAEVTNVAYSPLADNNTAVRAICVMLVAGRDNFRTSPWSNQQPWEGVQFDIHSIKIDDPNAAAFALIGPEDLVAYVNPDGMWSVDWPVLIDMRLLPKNVALRPGVVAMIGFCEALYGAKDNFHTLPME